MSDRWIMDVLADLRSFARSNDLPQLADQLDLTTTVAALELANRPQVRSKSADRGPLREQQEWGDRHPI